MNGRFGNGEGESEGTRENDCEKPNNDLKVSRRRFIKASATFGVAGSSYNLTDITDIVLKEDGEVIMYPVIYEYEIVSGESYKKHRIGIKLWGCNWKCKWCPTECCCGLKGVPPLGISIDKLTELLLTLDGDATTMFTISGGEPLLQKEEVPKLIESVKKRTNYSCGLATNGSLIEANFVEEANAVGLDTINISFYNLDDEWHKEYTGHSNQATINALKLVSDKFEGLTAVSLIPFSNVDTSTFNDMCEFLYRIKPDFAIKIYCPFYPDHEREECEKIRYKLDEIALQYFKRVDRSVYYTTQFKQIKYQIEEDERGYLNLVKIDE